MLFRWGGQEYQIIFSGADSLLDYSKVINISPDKRKYRYFSNAYHPFKEDVDKKTQVILHCEKEEKIVLLDDWQFPEEFLLKKCDISILQKTFRNLIFFPEEILRKWSSELKETYPIDEDVFLPFAPKHKIGAGEAYKKLTYKKFPVVFEICRKGGFLQIAEEKVLLSKVIKIDMRDFKSSRLVYLHGKKSHSAITSEVSIQRNNQFLNYIAAHKVSLPCTSLDLLNVCRSYDNYDLFSERSVVVRLFLNKAEDPHNGEFNRGVYCDRRNLKKCIGNDPQYPKFKFIITDYTSERVLVDNGVVSHPIPHTLRIEESRYLYCLPVEKQDGEFVKIRISEIARIEGDSILQESEVVDVSNVFSGELENAYGLLTFFVYEKNGFAFRYSPGFFLGNPKEIVVDNLTPLQRALCSCKIDELNEIFSIPGQGDFIEKVFDNAEKINAGHFFNLFFNNLRDNGKYIVSSSFSFRAADYWIPAAFTFDENGNYTSAHRRLNEHWDFELFGYEETQLYLPKIAEEELLKQLKYNDNEPAMGSLYYLRMQTDSTSSDNKFKKLRDSLVDSPLLEKKILFLINLFRSVSFERWTGLSPQGDIFISTEKLFFNDEQTFYFSDLAYALDELAYRIHKWKKNPHLSEISNDSNWDRGNGRSPYYYTEQYFRGELVYWRNMFTKEKGFGILRDLLLARIAEYAKFNV